MSIILPYLLNGDVGFGSGTTSDRHKDLIIYDGSPYSALAGRRLDLSFDIKLAEEGEGSTFPWAGNLMQHITKFYM